MTTVLAYLLKMVLSLFKSKSENREFEETMASWMRMTVNRIKCKALIAKFEGCKLTVYKDIAGYNTVGYGHRTQLQVGSTITQLQAEMLLDDDLSLVLDGIRVACTVPLNSNQSAALASFVFNLGIGALKSSHLLKELNDGNYDKAAEQFPLWCHAGNPPKEVLGLVLRREEEKTLFLTPAKV